MRDYEVGVFNFVMSGFGLAIGLLTLVSLWRVFTKAGQPGWAAIIPFYNFYVLCKIAQKPRWWWVLLFIPVVNWIIALIVKLGVSESFGKGSAFGVGLWLLPIIFYPILALGDAQYRPAAAAVSPAQSGVPPLHL
jgi:Family of unknown function (DUF5684)